MMKLLHKWRRCCGITKFDVDNNYIVSNSNYVGTLGDKFFEKHIKHSRHWTQIQIECDIRNISYKGISKDSHPLHFFCPSMRMSWRNHYLQPKVYTTTLDFSSLYPTKLV